MRSSNEDVGDQRVSGPQNEGDRNHFLTNKVCLFSPQKEWVFHSTSSGNARLYTFSVCQG